MVGSPHTTHIGHPSHRCSFHPDRQDLYTRLNAVTVFVRDQERSLQFYREQLGFELAYENQLPSGDRWLGVAPPDGTAVLALVAPKLDSEEYKLIGRATQIAFLTEDVFAKFEEWQKRGVRFDNKPQTQPWGGVSASFEDPDGNSFVLVGYDPETRAIEAQRREHADRLEAQRRFVIELETARQVQARLFPQTQPSLGTLEYSGLCIQAREVGGDYYDFLDLGRQKLGLVIGDTSGKGTAAALLMATLQAHVRNLSTSYSGRPFTPFALEQPQRFLKTVNRLFFDSTTETAYATFIFAEYDDTSRRLRYANCGHLSALLLRADNTLEQLEPTCTVLGLFPDWDCGVSERWLFPKDKLVLYTDGVTESFNDKGEQFGDQRLIDAFVRHRDLPASSLVQLFVEEIHRFSTREQHDDITVIAAECK